MPQMAAHDVALMPIDLKTTLSGTFQALQTLATSYVIDMTNDKRNENGKHGRTRLRW